MRRLIILLLSSLFLFSSQVVAHAEVTSTKVNVGLLNKGIPSSNNPSEIKRASCIARELFLNTNPKRTMLTLEEIKILESSTFKMSMEMIEGVNVNIHCQYGFYIKDGEIIKIFRVSSGKSGLETKLGTFKIYYKFDGWWNSTLYPGSWMYRPRYFYKGMAFHGLKNDSSVKPYPASHGCLRIYKKVSDFLWNNMEKDTLVRIYGKY